ncbi:MAG: beta-lactamase class A-like protein [Microgenomates group bacterium GW2011_GWB1_40_9]|nr:MAG: beta-lactamase class A-like protein [Microgenomates group bacterium GW2011_GWC1_39_12]KKR79907.1 MAG: beta-lactamase class A-like protein [Microgenomates group bacterium GW2011_GWB1_40_9]
MSKKRTSIGRFIIFLFFLTLLIIVLYQTFRLIKKEPIISPIPPNEKVAVNIFSFLSKKKDPDELKKLIKQKIGLDWKNYSILVVDTKSDFRVAINDTEMFTAASVNKIPILAALYIGIQNTDIDPDTVITVQEEDIQDYGTGSIRYDGAGSTYTIKTLARLMMQQSDNTAAYILANHIIRLDTIQSLLNEWGMTQTDMINNKTANNDVYKIIKKIYQGNIANPAYTQEMLAFFKDTEFEDRIPGLLPKTVQVYHKIGSEIGYMHDVGVVVAPSITYYIGIFTSDITNEKEATKLMAEVSKLVYDYIK